MADTPNNTKTLWVVEDTDNPDKKIWKKAGEVVRTDHDMYIVNLMPWVIGQQTKPHIYFTLDPKGGEDA